MHRLALDCSALTQKFLMALLDEKAKAKSFFLLKCMACTHFSVRCMKYVHFRSNLLVTWRLMTGGYQGRPMKCAHFDLNYMIERPLSGMVMVIPYLIYVDLFERN